MLKWLKIAEFHGFTFTGERLFLTLKKLKFNKYNFSFLRCLNSDLNDIRQSAASSVH